MNRRFEMLHVLALLLALPVSAAAAECLPKATGAWVRLTPVATPMMAGFARIENPCRAPIAIVGAESLAFVHVSLHETREDGGVSRMREVLSLTVPAGGAVELKPGGLHLMLHGPYQPVQAGERPVITLKLEDGRSVPVTFEVRRRAP